MAHGESGKDLQGFGMDVPVRLFRRVLRSGDIVTWPSDSAPEAGIVLSDPFELLGVAGSGVLIMWESGIISSVRAEKNRWHSSWKFL